MCPRFGRSVLLSSHSFMTLYLCSTFVSAVRKLAGSRVSLLCSYLPFTNFNTSRKIKQSHYGSEQPQRVPGFWGSHISRQLALEGGKVVSPKQWPSLPREIFLGLISVRGWVNPRTIMRPEGLCRRKIPMTPSRIETATFQVVAKWVNQLRHRVPPTATYTGLKIKVKICRAGS